jgi:hypothetical protein
MAGLLVYRNAGLLPAKADNESKANNDKAEKR